MAIKLNGVEITSNKLNGDNVLVEKLNGTVVYSFSPTTAVKWQFVGTSSSEPDTYDLLIYQNINGQYKQGIQYFDINHPVFEFYEVSTSDYDQANDKLSVAIPDGGNEIDVMNAFITQQSQWYEEYVVDYGSWGYAVNNLVIKATNEIGNIYYWKPRATGDYQVGFIIVINDLSTQDYFEYVVVAI